MDDEEETYRLWKIRKTIMQVRARGAWRTRGPGVRPSGAGRRKRESAASTLTFAASSRHGVVHVKNAETCRELF